MNRLSLAFSSTSSRPCIANGKASGTRFDRVRPRRRGTTSLSEALVALLFVPITLSTVAMTLSTVYRADRRLVERQELQRTHHHLTLRLRDDCRQATMVTVAPPLKDEPRSAAGTTAADSAPSDDSRRLIVTVQRQDGRLVQYDHVGDFVERIVRQGDITQHRDSHRIGANLTAVASISPEQPLLLRLQLRPRATVFGPGSQHVFEFALPATTQSATPRRRRLRTLGTLPLRTRRRIARRGVLLIVALVGLLVVGLFTGATVQRAVSARHEVRSRQQQRQVEWIADSAVRRASARLAATPRYQGETWQVSLESNASSVDDAVASSSATNASGVAVIAVTPLAENPRLVRVDITVRLPADPVTGLQARREVALPITPAGDSS